MEKPDNEKECYVSGKVCHFAQDCWSRANHDKMVNEVEVEDPNAEPGKEYVYTIEHEVNVVNLSQSGCGVNKIEERKQPGIGTQEPLHKQPGSGTKERMNKQPGIGTQEIMNKQPGSGTPRTHESLVMIGSGASVNVCPKWFGNSKLEQFEEQTENRSRNTERDRSG